MFRDPRSDPRPALSWAVKVHAYLASVGGFAAIFAEQTDAGVAEFLRRIAPIYFQDPRRMGPGSRSPLRSSRRLRPSCGRTRDAVGAGARLKKTCKWFPIKRTQGHDFEL